jgi:hypothetical protein
MSGKMPERIEREMSEIRSRMEPDVTDLRKHIESQVVTKQVKQTIRQRLRQAADSSKANLKAKQRGFADSAKSSLSLVRRKISNGRGE